MKICVRPYNAFSPVCCGTICCTGCCPIQMGCPGPMVPPCAPYMGGCCPFPEYCCPPSCCSSGCCDAPSLPAPGNTPPGPGGPTPPPPPGGFTPPPPTPMPSISHYGPVAAPVQPAGYYGYPQYPYPTMPQYSYPQYNYPQYAYPQYYPMPNPWQMPAGYAPNPWYGYR